MHEHLFQEELNLMQLYVCILLNNLMYCTYKKKKVYLGLSIILYFMLILDLLFGSVTFSWKQMKMTVGGVKLESNFLLKSWRRCVGVCNA